MLKNSSTSPEQFVESAGASAAATGSRKLAQNNGFGNFGNGGFNNPSSASGSGTASSNNGFNNGFSGNSNFGRNHSTSLKL